MRRPKLDSPLYARWLMQIGLAGVLLYAGLGGLFQPAYWVGYLPTFLSNLVSPSLLITIFAVYELLLAVWLLSGIWLKWVGLLVAATLTGIMLLNLGSLVVTFRDFGLILMALALIFLPEKQR